MSKEFILGIAIVFWITVTILTTSILIDMAKLQQKPKNRRILILLAYLFMILFVLFGLQLFSLNIK